MGSTKVQQDCDPAYYGNVAPDDADDILVRWLTDSGDYQVIYGDLTTETLTADELAELEAAQPGPDKTS